MAAFGRASLEPVREKRARFMALEGAQSALLQGVHPSRTCRLADPREGDSNLELGKSGIGKILPTRRTRESACHERAERVAPVQGYPRPEGRAFQRASHRP